MSKKFSVGSLGDNLGFYWDPSLPFCVCGVSMSMAGPVQYWEQGQGEVVDCRLPAHIREKICRGEMDNILFNQWREGGEHE